MALDGGAGRPARPGGPPRPGCALGGLTCGSPCSPSGEEGERGAQHAGVLPRRRGSRGPSPKRGRAAIVYECAMHGDQHDRQGDGQPRHHFGTLAPYVGLAHEQSRHGATASNHDRDQLLRDPARQMPRTRLKIRSQCSRWKEHRRSPAGRQHDGRRNPRGTCAFFPTPNTAISACVPNSPALHATQRCEQTQRPLEFHYSFTLQSRLRR